MKDRTVDEETAFTQFFDDIALEPGTRDARIMSVLFTLMFAVMTIAAAISAFQAIWGHHIWTGMFEGAAALAFLLVALVLVVVAVLEFTISPPAKIPGPMGDGDWSLPTAPTRYAEDDGTLGPRLHVLAPVKRAERSRIKADPEP